MLEVIHDAIERSLSVADCEWMEHEAEDPVGVGKCTELIVCQVAGVIVDHPASSVRADHRSAVDPGYDLAEGRGGRVREIDDHSELHEPVDECPSEA